MSSFCKILDCLFEAQFDGDMHWNAIRVDRAGNQTTLETGFDTEEEAEAAAEEFHREELKDNGQFGVGA